METIKSVLWIPLFIIWWVAIMVIVMFLPAALAVLYNNGNYSIDLSVLLYRIGSTLAFPIFPMYIVWYTISIVWRK